MEDSGKLLEHFWIPLRVGSCEPLELITNIMGNLLFVHRKLIDVAPSVESVELVFELFPGITLTVIDRIEEIGCRDVVWLQRGNSVT